MVHRCLWIDFSRLILSSETQNSKVDVFPLLQNSQRFPDRYLSKEIAIKALQAYLRQTGSAKPDLNKLLKYAKTLRVDIHPFIMALTT